MTGFDRFTLAVMGFCGTALCLIGAVLCLPGVALILLGGRLVAPRKGGRG